MNAPFPVSSDPTVPACVTCRRAPTDVQGAECSCTTDTCGAGMANALGAVTRRVAADRGRDHAGQRERGSERDAVRRRQRSGLRQNDRLLQLDRTGLKTPPNQAAATFIAPTSGSVTATVTVTDDAGRQDSADVVLTPTSATTAAPSSCGHERVPRVRRAAAAGHRHRGSAHGHVAGRGIADVHRDRGELDEHRRELERQRCRRAAAPRRARSRRPACSPRLRPSRPTLVVTRHRRVVWRFDAHWLGSGHREPVPAFSRRARAVAVVAVAHLACSSSPGSRRWACCDGAAGRRASLFPE